jgi:hypothetical protein
LKNDHMLKVQIYKKRNDNVLYLISQFKTNKNTWQKLFFIYCISLNSFIIFLSFINEMVKINKINKYMLTNTKKSFCYIKNNKMGNKCKNCCDHNDANNTQFKNID